MYEFISQLKNKKAQQNFLAQALHLQWCSSKQMFYYIDMHLEYRSINTVILHVDVNELLKNYYQSNIYSLM